MRTAFILLTVGVAASSAASDEDYQNALDLLGLSKDDVAGLQASKARRAEQSGPSIDTEDGNVVFSIENGKHVGYKFPDGKVVNVDELPAEMGEYAEHGIELSTSAMSLGYKVGSAKAQAEATIATTLEFVKSTIEGTARDAKAFTEKQDQVNKNLEGGVDAKLAAVDSKLETAATQQAAAAAQQKKEAEDAAAAQKKATEDALAKLKADLTADVKTQLAAGLTKGRSKENPESTCVDAYNSGSGSGFFWLKCGNNCVFEGWCEMTLGGGWLQIVHGKGKEYKTEWTSSTARKAVGGIPSPNHDKMTKYLSKLSDVQINGYMSQWAAAKDGVQAVYQFRSSCAGKDSYPGPHPWAMYIGSYQKTYDDSKNGMDLQKPKEPDVCFGQRPCKLVKNQWPGDTGVFDSPHSNGAGNNCQRFFQGHRGGVNPYQCYNPRVGGTQGQRCFSHGSSCRCKDDANNGEQGNHPQALNLQIFVKPPQNYVGYRDQRFYNR